MKRVQHNEVKPGITIKLPNHGPTGRWATIKRVIEVKPDTSKQAASAIVLASYLNGKDAGKDFQVYLYERASGYEVYPNSAMIAAKAVQRRGRADVENVALREYLIKFVAVDRVDNQAEPCGYCTDVYPRGIACNLYAMVTTESGRTEEASWSSCDACALHSIDQVEDVDPAHTVTIEGAAR
jgi:hypothetical protein